MSVSIYGNIPAAIDQYLPIIEKYAKKFSVPVMVIVGTIWTESRGNPMAWNPSLGENSRGLMQMSEKTALTHPAVLIPSSQLDSLYDPETNIYYGTKLLAYIRDYLRPYFYSDINPIDRWMTISSSYNQGEGYYKQALQLLRDMGAAQNWSNIKNAVLSLPKTPWAENVNSYASSVLSNLDAAQLIAPSDSVLAPLSNTWDAISDSFSINLPEMSDSTKIALYSSVALAGIVATYFLYSSLVPSRSTAK